jgi:hypothetical protein
MNCPSAKELLKIVTFGKGKRSYKLHSLLSSGNTKLPRTTATFNITPAKLCPSLALGLCKAYSPDGKHVCYAMKSETGRTPEVYPYRLRQMKYWETVTAEDFVGQFLSINVLKEVPWTKLRFNEAGDFRGQACLDKAEKIATYLSRFGIRTYCYTHRSDLNFSNIKNLVVTGSNFKKDGVTSTFVMVEDVVKDRHKGWSVCGGSCKVCDRCSRKGQNIVVKRH